jgi:predicted DNA-binding transcriptional regulator YafY
VEPYRIALALGGVYLIAYVPDYGEFRTFSLDRIQKLSISDATFRKTRELPADLFGSSMGVFSGEPETIVVEFAPTLAPYAQARVWHPSQKIEPLAGGRVKMTLSVSDDWALRSWILGFGAGITVVAPKRLADAIRSEHEAALKTSP